MLLLFLSTFVLCVFGNESVDHQETVNVTITDAGNYDESRVNHVTLPDKLHVTVHRERGVVSMLLEKNVNLQSDVPVIVGRHGNIIYQDVNETEIVGFYHSLDPSAAVMVTKDKNNQQSALKLMGDVKLHDVTYRLHLNHDNQDYMLLKLKNMFDEESKLQISPDRDITGYRTTVDADMEASKNLSDEYTSFVSEEERINKMLYEVEVMAVADYSEYLFWLNSVSESAPTLPFIYRDMLAKNKLKQYIGFILNAVDLRYRSITTRNYEIRILLSAVYLADSKESSPWTDFNNINPYKLVQVDADTVIAEFTDWCETYKTYLPHYDHAMLLTKHDIVKTVDGEVNKNILGVSYIGDICFDKKQSLIEDSFGEDVALATAHEIGHNLGAEHDGVLGFCLTEDEFIMSPVLTHDKPELRHHWQFSACSQYYFFRNFNNLNKLGLNCMSARESNIHLTLQLSSKLPGQIYSPDEQCEYRYGHGSYLFRNGYQGNYTSICSTLKCTVPKQIGYHFNTDTMEGTTCGNGKLCEGGYCVEDERAVTSVKDTCLFGDAPETYHGSQTRCTDILKERFWYAEYMCRAYKLSCCETCSNLYYVYARTTTPAVDNAVKQPAVGECVRSCVGLMDGHYQSCQGCRVYTSCFSGMMYDGRPCQRNLVWSDDVKRCEYSSNTC